MSLTDPIADMLTRIRNACRAQHKTVDIPSSKLKEAIAALLKREGYVQDFQVLPDDKQNVLRVELKYLEDKRNAIEGLRRVSKPSIRVYVNRKDVRPVRKYMGVAILSTTQGILTDREARAKGVGGEVLCEVW
jgi:small subunit ribosomal protein S8